MSAITVNVSGGFQELADVILTEINKKDISGATFQVALSASSSVAPATGNAAWVTPTVNTVGTDGNWQRILKLMIASPTAPGVWWLWGKIIDTGTNTEILSERRPSQITVL